LLGDSSKARRVLGWKPTVGFPELCHMMVEADLKRRGLTWRMAKTRAGKLEPTKPPKLKAAVNAKGAGRAKGRGALR
jgi:hypothetical protein